MSPYRSAPAGDDVQTQPWPLPVLVVAAVLSWLLVEHAIGSIAGRF